MMNFLYYERESTNKLLLILILIMSVLLISCKKDKDARVEFELLSGSPELQVSVDGTSETYSIRTSGYWTVSFVDDVDWIEVQPREGQGDATFTVSIDKNRQMESRSAALAFHVNHVRMSDLIRITQDENPHPPYFELDYESETLEVSGSGVRKVFDVRSNTQWEVIVPQEVDWISVEPAAGNGEGEFVVVVDENPLYSSRSALLSYKVDGIAHGLSLNIIQGGKVDNSIILNEDFEWLTYGSPIFYTTTGETRFDNWTDEEKAKGWTSTVNTVSGSGDQPLLYARSGFVKLGKTSYGGDLVSPKLSTIVGESDVVVTFKAVPYQTKAGARDDNTLKVSVIGPGKVSHETFIIDNWPDYDADPECVEIWKNPSAQRTFIIKGATAETQIRFVGGDFDLRPDVVQVNKNRIFLDDIIVVLDK